MDNQNDTPLGRYFHNASRRYLGAFTNKLKHLDLERHYYILTLVDNGREVTQKDLAEFIEVDKVTMSRMIDYLVDKKHIVRVCNPHDRRAFFLRLTPKAKKILPEVKQAVWDLNQASFDGISEEEQEKFLDIMNKVIENLNRLPADFVKFNYKTITDKKRTKPLCTKSP